jgi:superfamily I DNA/RNA helicase
MCLDVVLLSTQGAKSGSQKNHHTQNKKNTKNKKNKKEQGGVVDRSKGVYVGTAHQSKGLEWKVVFVVSMHDGESFFCVFVFFLPYV